MPAPRYPREPRPQAAAWPSLSSVAPPVAYLGHPTAALGSLSGAETGRLSAAATPVTGPCHDQLEKTGLLHAGAGRAARISRETRDSVLASLDDERFQQVARIAADMLVDYWTMLEEEAYEAGQQRFDAKTEPLAITNTGTLVATAGEALWRPEAHDVLFHRGYYLGDRERELAYWRDLLAEAERILGPEHLSTFRVRAAGRIDEAGTLLEETVATAVQAKTGLLTTHLIRDSLVDVYCGVGRYDDAVVQREEGVTQRTRRMGARHTYTLSARNSLGEVLHTAGRTEEAAAEYRAVVATCEAQNPSTNLTVQEIQDEAVKGLADMGGSSRLMGAGVQPTPISRSEGILREREGATGGRA